MYFMEKMFVNNVLKSINVIKTTSHSSHLLNEPNVSAYTKRGKQYYERRFNMVNINLLLVFLKLKRLFIRLNTARLDCAMCQKTSFALRGERSDRKRREIPSVRHKSRPFLSFIITLQYLLLWEPVGEEHVTDLIWAHDKNTCVIMLHGLPQLGGVYRWVIIRCCTLVVTFLTNSPDR